MKGNKDGFWKRTRKTWLTVGIVLFIVCMAIEIWLGNYGSLVLIIPALYLNSIRRTL